MKKKSIYEQRKRVKNISGVYCIKNLKNGKRYIGSSIFLRKRITGHIWQLDRKIKKHHSITLQRAWDKYGPENFSLEILYLVPDYNNLIPYEQMFMDLFKSSDKKYGYNISKKAGNTLGVRPTKEHLEKLRKPKKSSFDFVCVENGMVFHNSGDASRALEKKALSKMIPANIYKCLAKKIKSIGGFHFFATKELPFDYVFSENGRINLSKAQKILLLKEIGEKLFICKETGEIFFSPAKAAKKMGLPAKAVYSNLYGRSEKCKGYTFEYV